MPEQMAEERDGVEQEQDESELDAAFESIAWMPQKPSKIVGSGKSLEMIFEGKSLDEKSGKKFASSTVREFVENLDEKRKLSKLYSKLSATAAAALECTSIL